MVHELEAGQAVEAVSVEARLALLAVVDHVQSGIPLLAHHPEDLIAHHRLEMVGVVGLAPLPGDDHGPETLCSGQAPGVGGEDVMVAAAHGSRLPGPRRAQQPAGASRYDVTMIIECPEEPRAAAGDGSQCADLDTKLTVEYRC